MTVTETVREIVDLSREEELPFKAAGIAFYAVTSLIPLLIISLAMLSAVGAEDTLISLVQSQTPEGISSVVTEILGETQSHGVAGVVGLVFTLWSATKIFRGLSIGFEELYPSDPDLSLVEELEQSLVVILFILFAVVVVSVMDVALATVPFEIPAQRHVRTGLSLVFLVGGLLPIYYVLPPEEMTIWQALPGAILAAVGWVLLQFGFAIYAQNAGSYAAYGLLGVVLLFITFVYFASIILLVGAAVNVVLER